MNLKYSITVHAYECPITLEIMKDPVKTIYGHRYERKNIINWIKANGTCPLTRKPLRESDIKEDPEFALKVLEYLQ